MKGETKLALVLLVLAAVGYFFFFRPTTMTKIEVIHSSPEAVLSKIETGFLGPKARKDYRYRIIHHGSLQSLAYLKAHPEDAVVLFHSGQEKFYHIFTDNEPDKKFFKYWRWQ